MTGHDSFYYGLVTHFSSSIIHLLHPLTKEWVSTNNCDGRNYGGFGEIAIVDNNGTKIEIIQEVEEEHSFIALLPDNDSEDDSENSDNDSGSSDDDSERSDDGY